MKTKEIKSELAKLIDEIDDWEEFMERGGNQFVPAFNCISLSIDTLKHLRSKGLVTYSRNFIEYDGALEFVSITSKGYTYIEDEKTERNKWLIRTILVGAGTSIFTSLLVSWLLQR